MKNNIFIIILIILFSTLLYYLFFVKPKPISNTTTIIYRDTTIDTNIQTNLKPNYVTNENYYTNLPNDTNLIKKLLNDYLSKKYFNDTVRDDTSMTVIIQDTISKNNIEFRRIISKNNRPTLIQTITNIYDDKGLFINGSLLSGENIAVGTGLGYRFNKQSLSLNLYTNKFITLTYSKNINLFNKK